MAMNRVDRIVLDPNRTYACTRTARTGVRVTELLVGPSIVTGTTGLAFRSDKASASGTG